MNLCLSGCGAQTSPVRPFCQKCFNAIPGPLAKTVIFLWAEGRKRSGFEEAVENATAQINSRKWR